GLNLGMFDDHSHIGQGQAVAGVDHIHMRQDQSLGRWRLGLTQKEGTGYQQDKSEGPHPLLRPEQKRRSLAPRRGRVKQIQQLKLFLARSRRCSSVKPNSSWAKAYSRASEVRNIAGSSVLRVTINP